MGNNDYAANLAISSNDAPKDAPWCFWYGCLEPHRGYEFQSGVKKGGKKLSDIGPRARPTGRIRHRAP
jgi:N-sulfoglucosamine sulfohydrolase